LVAGDDDVRCMVATVGQYGIHGGQGPKEKENDKYQRDTPIHISRVRLPVICLGSSCGYFERYLMEIKLVRITTRIRIAEAAMMNSIVRCLIPEAWGEAASKMEDGFIFKKS